MSSIYGICKKNNNMIIDDEAMIRWNRAYGNRSDMIKTSPQCEMGCYYEKLSDHAECSDPVMTDKGSIIAIDAVVYNREELKNHIDCGDERLSDEELIYKLLSIKGMDELQYVNGDFAGAIFDTQKNVLTLFRDHMGIRPLFFTVSDGFVAFSTDIRGLLGTREINPEVNREYLYKLTMGYNFMSIVDTEYEHIKCVRPGSYMIFDIDSNGEVKTRESRYWRLGQKKVRFKSEKEYRDRLRYLIEDAVKIRSNAVSGALGAELSGGLDSGIIDILLNRMGRECIYYSWSRSPKELPYVENDERLVVRDICEQEGIECAYRGTLTLKDETNLDRKMKEAGYAVSEGDSWMLDYCMPSYSNTLNISETSEYISSRGSKVVFTGHGGDEGVSHRCNTYELFCHHEYYRYLKLMWARTAGQKHRCIRTLKQCRNNIKTYNNRTVEDERNDLNVEQFLKTEFKNGFSGVKIPSFAFAYDSIAFIENGGSRSRLDNVALQGAYSGVRYLVPYLDYRVIDFAVSIPRYLYLQGWENRYILRETFKDIMPKSLYDLQTKEDFSLRGKEVNPNWFDNFDRERHMVVDRLNREYWKPYFDFDRIDSWLEKKDITYEEYSDEYWKLICLSQCVMIHNAAQNS